MDRNKFLAIAVAASIIIAGGLIVAVGYREPEIESISIRPRVIGLSLIFDLEIDIHNPNMVGGTLLELDLEVYANDIYVGPLISTEIMDIPARDSAKLYLEYSYHRGSLTDIFFDTGPIKEIKVSGDAVVQIMFFTFSIDVYEIGTI